MKSVKAFPFSRKYIINMYKVCIACKFPKPLLDFHPHGEYTKNKCKTCVAEQAEVYRKTNKSKIKQRHLAHYGACKDAKRCTRCSNPAVENKTECSTCLIKRSQKAVARNLARKIKVMSSYGNKCKCCEEVELDFLTIDHINNDGAKHRKEIGKPSGSEFYRWIIKNNYPNNLQVLCANCNLSKKIRGYCIHTTANAKDRGTWI